jgi:ABC-2 type transport system ATP-binding protein
LSDIEALCDRVAILRNGKLAATGNLDDLLSQSGEQQVFEVNVKGVSAAILEDEVKRIGGAIVVAKPNGANIQITEEKDIDKILPIIRNAGGSLVSVQPVKQSLEELFVKETEN